MLRTEGGIVIATTASGIDATMMLGGRTSHSRFKIHTSNYTCDIGVKDPLGNLIREADLILWDEATMANRYAFESLDGIFRDLTNMDLPFGGKTLVLGGDFRQLLHVVERGSRAHAINACLTYARFWEDIKVIRLKEIMRSRLDSDFSDFLLRISDWTEPSVKDDMVRLSDDISMKWDGDQSVTRLINEVFPKLEENACDRVYISQRALITPNNYIVEKLNENVIIIFSGDEVVYHSFDTTQSDPKNFLTKDYLNKVAPDGFPPHKIILRIGAPIILFRTLDPSYGLCINTRLLCRGLYNNFIDAEIVTDSCSKMRVMTTRIPLELPKYSKLPFRFVGK